MICPHCGIGTSPNFDDPTLQGRQSARTLATKSGNCTECHGVIVVGMWVENPGMGAYEHVEEEFPLYPAGPLARPIPAEVTGEYAQDFREACLVVSYSPKASAALSRRLLQHVIREKAGITKRNLSDEIDAVMDEGDLPGGLAEDLDTVRTVGNFAAHPIKSTNTGEVVDVEPGEAEQLLDVVEELFDHYIVKPSRRKARRAALNEKLAGAGKSPLKRLATPDEAPRVAE